MSSPYTLLCLVLCLRPVFEGAGEHGIFSVPEPRGNFGILLSPRANMKRTQEWQLAQSDRNFSKSQKYEENLKKYGRCNKEKIKKK